MATKFVADAQLESNEPSHSWACFQDSLSRFSHHENQHSERRFSLMHGASYKGKYFWNRAPAIIVSAPVFGK